MIKKTLIFAALFSFLFLPSSVLAITTATPSAQLSVSPAPTNIEDKIKLLVKENLSTTEAKLKEMMDLQSLVGYVGTISSISSGVISIDTHGNLMQISTTDKTTIIKANAKIKATSLAIADKMIVIGTLIKDDILQAQRIVVIKDEPNPVKTKALVAKVETVDLKKKTIVLNISGTSSLYPLSKKNTVVLADLKPGQNIFAIIKEFEGKSSLAKAKVL